MTTAVFAVAVAGLVLVACGQVPAGLLVWAVLAAVLALVARSRVRGASGGGRVAVGHSHGVGRSLLRHEGSHVHAARSSGVRVVSATVTPSSGLVSMHPADVKRMSSRDYMAFMYAGRAAGGGAVNCSADMANVRDERRRMQAGGLSTGQVRSVEAAARRDARRYARAGAVDRYADRLGARGRL